MATTDQARIGEHCSTLAGSDVRLHPGRLGGHVHEHGPRRLPRRELS